MLPHFHDSLLAPVIQLHFASIKFDGLDVWGCLPPFRSSHSISLPRFSRSSCHLRFIKWRDLKSTLTGAVKGTSPAPMNPSIATAHGPRTLLKAGAQSTVQHRHRPPAAHFSPALCTYLPSQLFRHSLCPQGQGGGGLFRGIFGAGRTPKFHFHFLTHSFKHGLYLNFTHCAFRRFMTLSLPAANF